MRKQNESLYLIDAEKIGRKWAGVFKAPGLDYDRAKGKDGNILYFDYEKDARIAAADALTNVLNTPRRRAQKRQGRTERYHRLSGPEFAEKLKAAGITMKLLIDVIGTKEQRVLSWIDGVDEKGVEELAPHYVNVLLEIFAKLPAAIDIAEDVTDRFTTALRDRIEAPFTPEQMAHIQARQDDPMAHSYTCPGDQPECVNGRDLEVTKDGMICGCGMYRQTWAHVKAPTSREG